MKADAGPDWDDGPERDRLRVLLRAWSAPEAPRAIEDDLRSELRKALGRRRRGGMRALWLPLAAGLAGLAAWPLLAPDPGARPASAPAPPAPLASGAPTEAVSEARPLPSAPARRAIAAGRAPGPRTAGAAVIVEPAQAELLAEFGRRAWETPTAPGGEASEVVFGAEAPSYRGEWHEIAGEWPAIQVVVPSGGR